MLQARRHPRQLIYPFQKIPAEKESKLIQVFGKYQSVILHGGNFDRILVVCVLKIISMIYFDFV